MQDYLCLREEYDGHKEYEKSEEQGGLHLTGATRTEGERLKQREGRVGRGGVKKRAELQKHPPLDFPGNEKGTKRV